MSTRVLAGPAGDDLVGQAIEKAILTYRATKSAPFLLKMSCVTHRIIIKVFQLKNQEVRSMPLSGSLNRGASTNENIG